MEKSTQSFPEIGFIRVPITEPRTVDGC